MWILAESRNCQLRLWGKSVRGRAAREPAQQERATADRGTAGGGPGGSRAGGGGIVLQQGAVVRFYSDEMGNHGGGLSRELIKFIIWVILWEGAETSGSEPGG